MGGLEQIKCTVNISGSDGDRLQISTDLGSNPAAAARWLGDLRQAAWALQLRGALSGKGATTSPLQGLGEEPRDWMMMKDFTAQGTG